MKKNKNKKKLAILQVCSFLLGAQGALVAYVMSSFLKKYSGLDNAGFFYLISYLLAFLVLLKLHHFVKLIGKYRLFFIFLSMEALALFLAAFVNVPYLKAFFAVIFLFSSPITWTLLDLLIESFSQDKKTGEIRGANLTALNTGWLIATVASISILSITGSYLIVFAIPSIFSLSALAIVWRNLRKEKERKVARDFSLITVIKRIKERKNVWRIYLISLSLEFFYAIMIVYVPIHLLAEGFAWREIGWIFTVMLLPFILIQYPLGLLADKKTGEKEILILAVLLLGVTMGIIPFINAGSIIVWMVVLFVSRVGAAAVEVLRDSYFYKQVDSGDADLIDFFRTARSVGNILAMGLAVMLFGFGLKWIFLISALLVLFNVFPALKLKDTK